MDKSEQKPTVVNSNEQVYRRKCTHDEWKEFIRVMQSGKEFEVDEEMWDYWLEVLPPVLMNRKITFIPLDPENPVKRTMVIDFGFAEGAEHITMFWRSPDGKRFFGQRTTMIAPLH
jgi:hypothetical protein